MFCSMFSGVILAEFHCMNSSSKPDGTILLHTHNLLNSAALFKTLLFGILR